MLILNDVRRLPADFPLCNQSFCSLLPCFLMEMARDLSVLLTWIKANSEVLYPQNERTHRAGPPRVATKFKDEPGGPVE